MIEFVWPQNLFPPSVREAKAWQYNLLCECWPVEDPVTGFHEDMASEQCRSSPARVTFPHKTSYKSGRALLMEHYPKSEKLEAIFVRR